MNSDYDALRSLYRAARADEGSTPADRDAVRMGLMAAAAIGVQSVSAATASAASWSLAPGASAAVASTASASAVGTSAAGAAGSASAAATVASAKGVVQLLLGGKFLGGLVVGAAIGTAVSATAYVVDPPKAQLTAHSAAQARANQARLTQARAMHARPGQPHVHQRDALLSTTALPATPVAQPQPETPTQAQPAPLTELQGPAVPVESIGVHEHGQSASVVPERNVSARPRSASLKATNLNPVQPAVGRIGPDRLLEETEALAQVQAALDRKEPGAAMDLLNQQRRDFPKGQLAEERSAALVLALCAAGRTLEAEQARTKFLLEHPKSPLTKRVSKSCETP